MARHFQQVFPKKEGYEVTLTLQEQRGFSIEINTPYDQYGRPIKCACCGTTENVHPDGGSGGPYRCAAPSCIVF
jgi:hypothetical protein